MYDETPEIQENLETLETREVFSAPDVLETGTDSSDAPADGEAPAVDASDDASVPFLPPPVGGGLPAPFEDYLLPVSGGDLLQPSSAPAPAPVQAVQADSPAGTEDALKALESIRLELSIIIFLLLFFWCSARVRKAVRMMGGGMDG